MSSSDVWAAATNPDAPKSGALGLVTPMAVKDIYAVMKDQGVPAGIISGIMVILGESVMTYEDKKPEPKKTNSSQSGGRLTLKASAPKAERLSLRP